ncbi:MAG TPA: S41 family peptidase [Aggregatilineales bacterium]|nr:S41 family peptidase [Aggregatilineales bacterium]
MVLQKSWVRALAVAFFLVFVFAAGFVSGASHPETLAMAEDGQPSNTVQLFGPFWQSWNLIHEQYVDPIDDEKLMEGAASGMVAALGDPHTAYMQPDLFTALNSDLSGQFDGIGATIRKDPASGGIQIISTIAGSPARQGGLKDGDIIVDVDGKDITTLSETDILGRVRGPAGSKVLLGLLRKGQKKLVNVTLTRAQIVIPIVESAMYDGKIGYVKLSEFSDTAVQSLSKALKQMDANHLNGLIFDLRDNPGGGLGTAISVASMFIQRGPIVIERGKPRTQDTVLYATGNPIAPTVPMVVLINGGSASASELVSGAFQDHGRAVLVGTQSYGKGSVQLWNKLDAGGGVRITIAHFYTPKGRIIHERGLTPDEVVPWDTDVSPIYDPQLAEALWVLRGEF